MDSGKDIGKSVVRNLFAIHTDTFVDSFKVRRSIESSAVTGVAKNGFEKCRSRAFAVGPRDVDGRVFLFRVVETFCEDGDVFKIELGGCGLGWRGELAAQREQIADRFLEVHFNSSASRVRK